MSLLRKALFSHGRSEPFLNKVHYYLIHRLPPPLVGPLLRATRFSGSLIILEVLQAISNGFSSMLAGKLDLAGNRLFNDTPLCKRGYINVSEILNISDVDAGRIRSYVLKAKMYDGQVPINSSHTLVSPVDGNYFSLPPDDPVILDTLRKYLASGEIFRIAEDYLGFRPCIYSINTMLTLPSEVSHPVCQLHRDLDDFHFLVLFIYWTAVTAENGATYFIPETHSRDIDQSCCSDLGVFLEGKAGSAFLADTIGFHSGNPNLKSPRVVTWVRFGRASNYSSFHNKEYLFSEEFKTLLQPQD